MSEPGMPRAARLDRAGALALGGQASALLLLAGAVGTLLADGPYLSLSKGIEPWLAAFALGLLGLLLFLPFLLHRRLFARNVDPDTRWERAVAAWGGVALVLGAAMVLVLWIGPGSDQALGALAWVALLECGLVVGPVGTLVLTTG
jgi:hypothetical protein